MMPHRTAPLSYAYDGKRRRKWNVSAAPYGEAWTAGDVIGCCIDMDAGRISFTRNGVDQVWPRLTEHRSKCYFARFWRTNREEACLLWSLKSGVESPAAGAGGVGAGCVNCTRSVLTRWMLQRFLQGKSFYIL